ncbi:dihydrodipicolinate reductase [Thalassovita aquimarina]|uniref:Dihydrodipicolinate reductase n=1 Tax=Thalassovita aquimarina TaxID=2785917 RepID=A0ABS5HMK8_9RHOB|nr:dihydrodipicolinate reductase [Thalassovita aquimarina]MBR9650190.1 dihydrodipicolinate reductase [Thalassovita aquimarina]
MIRTLILSLALLSVAPAHAAGFRTITDRSSFLELIEGRKLTKFLYTMRFSELGQIKGWAWGRPILGNWYWQNRQLCKRVFIGTSDQGEFCVTVRFDGETMIFVPKPGDGEIEEFRVK